MTVAELIKELEKMPQDAIARLNGKKDFTIDAVFYDEKYDCVMIID